MNIIYEELPYSAIPMYYTDENCKYYTVSGIDDKAELVLMKKERALIAPLFDQKINVSYKLGANVNKVYKEFSCEKDKLKQKQKIIFKLFEDVNCDELKVIYYSESFSVISYEMIWSRSIGYWGKVPEDKL